MTSLCAIIPVASKLSANTTLETAGFGKNNFSVPLYSSGAVAYAGLHAWSDTVFTDAVKAIAGVVWEESNGEPVTRFNALVNAQGSKWGGNAPDYPIGLTTAGALYRHADNTLWQVIQQYDTTTFNAHPSTYPALIRAVREVGKVYEWVQPIDQYDAYKLLNPFTGQNDECDHLGKRWYVTQADGDGNNVWEPSVFGWSLTDPTPNIFVRAWNWLTNLFN